MQEVKFYSVHMSEQQMELIHRALQLLHDTEVANPSADLGSSQIKNDWQELPMSVLAYLIMWSDTSNEELGPTLTCKTIDKGVVSGEEQVNGWSI